MTNAAKFQLCLEQARKIVASYRHEAPQGCDPQNTWVAVGTTVVGGAVSLLGSKGKSGGGGGGGGGMGKAPQISPIKFPQMPPVVTADIPQMDQAWYQQDLTAFQRSDSDFLKRHPETVDAEKAFEHQTMLDQTGDSKFLPQVQQEYMNSGLGSALNAFGNMGPVLARGGAAEADVAKNLGLSVLGFQDRNRQNAQQSLSLAEQIFPRRQLGPSGSDLAGIQMGNISATNSWNQADYAGRVSQLEFNKQIEAGNQSTQIQGQNAQAQAQAQAAGSQGQMYGQLAQTAIGALGQGFGNYRATAAGMRPGGGGGFGGAVSGAGFGSVANALAF